MVESLVEVMVSGVEAVVGVVIVSEEVEVEVVTALVEVPVVVMEVDLVDLAAVVVVVADMKITDHRMAEVAADSVADTTRLALEAAVVLIRTVAVDSVVAEGDTMIMESVAEVDLRVVQALVGTEEVVILGEISEDIPREDMIRGLVADMEAGVTI